MKVLVISPTFPPMSSGGADYSFRLCQHLAKAGNDVTVVTSDIPDVITSDAFKILSVMRSWDWGELRRLLKIVRECDPDVIDIHFSGGLYKQHPMITFLPALVKRRLKGVRVILHIEYPEPVRCPGRRSVTRLVQMAMSFKCGRQNTDYGYGTLLRDSDQVIVLCDTHVHLLAEHHAEIARKCLMIPPPPSVRLSDNTDGKARRLGRTELGVGPTDILLAYYGYIYPNKGIETLIKALELVVKKLPNVRLVLIGGANDLALKAMNRPKYLEELKDRTGQLGIAEKVAWTKYFPSDSEQPSILLRAADICILPFDDGISMHRSTFGVAAMHGLPIVTTRRKNPEIQFTDGQNVLLCPPKDSEAMAEAIIKLISDLELQERLRNGVRTMTAKYFSWDKCIEQTIQVFRGKSPV